MNGRLLVCVVATLHRRDTTYEHQVTRRVGALSTSRDIDRYGTHDGRHTEQRMA